MAKLGWRMCHGEENLAQKCIISKYVRNSYVISFRKGSHVWKDIGKGWHILSKNCMWIVENGHDVSFWNDNWLGFGPLKHFVYGPLSIEESLLKVSDKLSFDLPEFVIYLILDMIPLSDTRE